MNIVLYVVFSIFLYRLPCITYFKNSYENQEHFSFLFFNLFKVLYNVFNRIVY